MDSSNEEEIHFNLLFLPTEILEKILSFLSYDEISYSRLVSRKFDCLCQARLNDGLNRADRLHSRIHREIKAMLPRRESERRNHALARHVDILSAVETRLSLLNMTYSKYIENGVCCFIPGKVLDEIFHVLRRIRLLPVLPRGYELLQELRDISSMAIEHFDEKIVPVLRKTQSSYSDSLESIADAQKSRAQQLNSTIMRFNRTLLFQKKLIRRQNRRIENLQKNILEEKSLNNELQRRQAEQNRRIAELDQKVADYDQKFVDMTVEISRVRGAFGMGGDDGGQAPKGGSQQPAEGVGCGSKGEPAQPGTADVSKTSSRVGGKTRPKQRKPKQCVKERPSGSADKTINGVLVETGCSKSTTYDLRKRRLVDHNDETVVGSRKATKRQT